MKQPWMNNQVLWIALVFAALPFLSSSVGVNVATEVVIFTLYALAFNLLLGYTGIVSFGHSLFFGIGVYSVGLLQIHYDLPSTLALILAGCFAAFAAIVVGAIIIGKLNIYFALLTLAFTQMAYELVFKWSSFTGGEVGLQGIHRSPIGSISLQDPWTFYIYTSLIALICIAMLWLLVQTPFGKVLQGIRENERRVRLLGCNTALYKFIAFGISAFFSGIAGGLDGLLMNAAFPQAFGWEEAGVILIITFLGGRRTFSGPMIGVLIYVFGRYYINTWTEHWMLIIGGVFIISILLLPDGLVTLCKFIPYPKKNQIDGSSALGGSEDSVDSNSISALTKTPGTLEVVGLSKRFGANEVAKAVTLSVSPGTILGILGPNGAGKTTFFNMLSGLIRPDAGSIKLQGLNVTNLVDYKRARNGMGRSLQIVSTFRGLSVWENIRLSVQLHCAPDPCLLGKADRNTEVNKRTKELINHLHLQEVISTDAGDLAYGDQRLVEIGITLAAAPTVLLLDEPLAGLAERERNVVVDAIRQLKGHRTVVLIEHDVERVMALADKIAILHQGALVTVGLPEEIANNPTVRQIYLGTENGAAAIGTRSKVREDEADALRVIGLEAGYGKSQIIHGIDLHVKKGEVVGLLGRNGVGKTTTVMSIAGTVKKRNGIVQLNGRDIIGWSADRVNRAGLGVVPQGRRIFPNLTVEENLHIACMPRNPGLWTIEKAFHVFPRLGERRHYKGSQLSGGEQQLLAIARTLMGAMEVVVLDEPMEGLSPTMAQLVMRAIEYLRQEGVAVLLVEQAVELALQLVDRVYVLRNGTIVYEGAPAELKSDPEAMQTLLGIQ